MNHCTILCDVCMEPQSSFSVGYRTVALAKKVAVEEGMWVTDHNDVCSRCIKLAQRKPETIQDDTTPEQALEILRGLRKAVSGR